MKQTRLSLERELPPITRKEPRLWVKSFSVYAALSPDKLIRRTDLHKGLNIIWAKDSEHGASGHAAGKSTFCRMLRYLLGDSTYGADDFKHAFHEKFPTAYVVGEVFLDGTPWLLLRTLSNHGKHHSLKGGSLDDLFATDTVFSDYSLFTEALSKAFITPLATNKLPGSGKEIEWKHLLHWLTRDQDSRYAHLLEWRPSHQNPDIKLSAADKTNLIRMVLGILEAKELKQQTEHNQLQSKYKELETLIPKLDYLCQRAEQKIRTQYSLEEGDSFFQFSGLKKNKEAELNSISVQWKRANSHDGVGEVLIAQLAAATAEVQRLEKESANLKIRLNRHKIDLSVCKGDISKEQRDIELSKMGPVEGLCSVLLTEASQKGCPLADSPNRDELQQAKLDQTKTEGEQIEILIKNYQSRRTITQQQLKSALSSQSRITNQVAKMRAAHAEQRNKISAQSSEIINAITTLTQTLGNFDELKQNRSDQKSLKRKLEQSSDLLKKLRTKATDRLSQLSDYYSEVATELLNQSVDGKVKFNAEEIIPSLNYSGDMSSAALVTLRLLIFDLACLIGSQHDIKHHPGFLVHDSPREADLSNSIYQRIFTLIAGGTPEAELQSVQYIIATTEPPPEHLQKNPWLAHQPFSSEKPETRFLKAII